MSRKKPKALTAVEHVDRDEPPAYFLSDDEQHILGQCRADGIRYKDLRRYLSQARQDKWLAEYDDDPSLMALAAFRHKMGELIESGMDYRSGGFISYAAVEHHEKNRWLWRLQGEIDGEQFNVELHLRLDEFS